MFPIEDEMLVIKEQDADDLLDERLEHENDSGEFVDINDPRLVSEIVEINPEADAFEPVTTVAIQPRWIHRCALVE